MEKEKLHIIEQVQNAFNAACLLNGYEGIIPTMKIEDSEIEIVLPHEEKIFYTIPAIKDKNGIVLEALSTTAKEIHYVLDMINMSRMMTELLGFNWEYEVSLKINAKNAADFIKLKVILAALEFEEIDIGENIDENLENEFEFSICYLDEEADIELIKGNTHIYNDNYVNYVSSHLENFVNTLSKKGKHDVNCDCDILEVYIIPKEEENFTDSSIIASDLHNMGIQAITDYRDCTFEEKLKTAKEQGTKAILIIDESAMSKFSVKLFDVALKEEKTVKLDNLIDELSQIL